VLEISTHGRIIYIWPVICRHYKNTPNNKMGLRNARCVRIPLCTFFSGVDRVLDTCRFGQWVKLWAGQGLIFKKWRTSFSNRITLCGDRELMECTASPPSRVSSLWPYCDGCSVGVVAGGAHAGRVGEHGAVDALPRLHHGPVAHGAHACPSGSGV